MDRAAKDPTIFIHGQESSSQGTKGLFFKEHFPEMIIPDFAGPLETRMSKLNEILSAKRGIIMIGSSLGGLMAALYAFQNQDKITKLILLAPALNLPEFTPYLREKLALPVYVFHGKNDKLIPMERIQEIAKTVFANLAFTLLDDDHRLSRKFTSIDWHELIADQ
ncbi:MAG: alpha/beta hydrolase [Deltaproteobacteria bacterium]|nr:alpha/beta hydrolase [Deltaproteobacteria bacterium]MBW2077012.1 alpha/beta hydrolase [Deltaproteobacteria bacterium]MBW2310351.1 alpha/beta hydrolase [Deltaproteobacteria bacterium]RLB31674.1 MAG: alpha/beta hydrolase [Deltaproteobacteria bacterium]